MCVRRERGERDKKCMCVCYEQEGEREEERSSERKIKSERESERECERERVCVSRRMRVGTK